MFPLTPSQTVGPFLSLALRWADGPEVVPVGTPGGFWIRGRVLDGAGEPVTDALVETWQADPDGRFDHPDDPRGASGGGAFRGFGRSETVTGEYAVYTVRPGALPTPGGGEEAPHLNVSVFARGLLDRVVTRIYFPEEVAANAADRVLRALPDDATRARLLAQGCADGFRFDICLQGDHESVFFDL